MYIIAIGILKPLASSSQSEKKRQKNVYGHCLTCYKFLPLLKIQCQTTNRIILLCLHKKYNFKT